MFPEAAETVNLAFETYSAHASIGQSAGFMSYEGAVADGTVLRPDAVTSANINETALEISEKDISLAA